MAGIQVRLSSNGHYREVEVVIEMELYQEIRQIEKQGYSLQDIPRGQEIIRFLHTLPKQKAVPSILIYD